MKKLTALALVMALAAPAGAMALQDGDDLMNSKTFEGFKVRNIGPAYMSGRISDIAVDHNDVGTWYVGVASGGVWKTVNSGTTWEPLFDDQAVYSIGDVTLDPQNSNIVWVGTGENNGGRHISFGDGVYKSLDGGKTWTNMGLEGSERIGDIVVHPEDSNTVWVTAQGPLWSKGGQRGLFKTTDGGKTWRNVMADFVDEWTGVGSLAIDPQNPDKLYAFTWQRQRTVAALIDSGPNSAFYTSDDGGETWRKITQGLPKGDIGKSSVAVSPMQPNVVYAAVETTERKGGFYRSEDFGESWTRMSNMVGAGTGPHYYQEIFVDPHTFDMVYFSNNSSSVSYDGGKTWEFINREDKHGDDHAFAFHPSDPDFVLIGTDGGIYESRDNMENWRYNANLPVTQFYKIAADDAYPFYNVYGGTQDNSTQGGPSRTDRVEGITNADWFLTMSADGHQPATEPGNPDILYSQMQQGGLVRYDHKTNEVVFIQPQPRPGEPAERFNWDAPINVSHHDPKRIYHASQRVWRSDDRGDSWTPISGDLTRNGNRLKMEMMDRTWGPESGWDLFAMSNFHTIANFAESPLDENLLYAGTDDGLIQVTTDGGQNWTSYEIGKIRGIPENAYVNDIRADRFDRDTVYAALDNHKEGDFKPYLIKSTNRGRTWTSIASNLPDKHLVWRITQDHVNPNLLFIGTEFGLFFTVDGGKKWVELDGGVPTISFRDVRIQRRENDLVAGSFGRGIYILDDYTPLRSITADTLEQEAALFPSRTALLYREDRLHASSQGADRYTAPNPEFGATMTYYLKDSYKTAKQKRVAADMKLKRAGENVDYPEWRALETENREESAAVVMVIKDSAGNVVNTVKAANKPGVHRVTWNLRYASQGAMTGNDDGPGYFGPMGAMATPGTYTATLHSRVDGVTKQIAGPVSFDVKQMREAALPGSGAEAARDFQLKAGKAMQAVTAANVTISELMKKMKIFRAAMDRAMVMDAGLEQQYRELRAELYAIDEALSGMKVRERKGATPATIASRIGFARRGGSTSYGPTAQHIEQLNFALEAFDGVKERLNSLNSVAVPAFQQALLDAGAPWTLGDDVPDAQ